jgi:hypothetical protein
MSVAGADRVPSWGVGVVGEANCAAELDELGRIHLWLASPKSQLQVVHTGLILFDEDSKPLAFRPPPRISYVGDVLLLNYWLLNWLMSCFLRCPRNAGSQPFGLRERINNGDVVVDYVIRASYPIAVFELRLMHRKFPTHLFTCKIRIALSCTRHLMNFSRFS